MRIEFTVDAALIRELGERLVGRPHIALAELIKNSYDADATRVEIRFTPNMIEVADNGHGMAIDEFRRFWMRIGSPHKQDQRVSRRLNRPLTGSKGIGRLSVQFLAQAISIHTVPEAGDSTELRAAVDWRQAVSAGDLTKASAEYEFQEPSSAFPNQSHHGTVLRLTDLNHNWTPAEIQGVAREIWWLQPPFAASTSSSEGGERVFHVKIESEDAASVEAFQTQMSAIHGLWDAQILGGLVKKDASETGNDRTAVVVLRFAGEEPVKELVPMPDCPLDAATFDIRIYNLRNRQPGGIRVDLARDYLASHGGIHVYDAGFHLPYYGPEHDWLGIEIDHSHRLSRSKLLPSELQVPEGMTHLPTQSRLLGAVYVDTAKERAGAIANDRADRGEYLSIQVSRDRLVDNRAYRELARLVRWGLDFYAMKQAQRVTKDEVRLQPVEHLSDQVREIERIIEESKGSIRKSVYDRLLKGVRDAGSSAADVDKERQRHIALLGALATAGMGALAYQHEIQKQFLLLEETIDQLGRNRESKLNPKLSRDLKEWLERARATLALFGTMLDEDNRERRKRFPARSVIETIAEQVTPLLRGIRIDLREIDDTLLLPEGSIAEWGAVFQNALFNAHNAMLDSKRKRIEIRGERRGSQRAIFISDTGIGVNVSRSERLFEPFIRDLKLSPERRALGYGGSGLGLTILRTVGESLGCRVAFVEPLDGFATTLRLSWREMQ
jgi:signal transduction histidine kinase